MERAALIRPVHGRDEPKPQSPRGRPIGSRSGYFLALEQQTARQAGLKQGLLSDPLVRISEAALILGVSHSTIRQLIKRGELRVSKTSARGHYRVRLSELRRLVRDLGVTHD